MDTFSDAGASQEGSTASSAPVVKRRTFSLRKLNIKPAVIHEGDEGAEGGAQASNCMSISQGRSDEAPLKDIENEDSWRSGKQGVRIVFVLLGVIGMIPAIFRSWFGSLASHWKRTCIT
eukprot:scaffold79867_cov54-Attheya_sp.AAC.1